MPDNYPPAKELFEVLANHATAMYPRGRADPIGIMNMLRGNIFPEEGFIEARQAVFEYWKSRRQEYPFYCPNDLRVFE